LGKNQISHSFSPCDLPKPHYSGNACAANATVTTCPGLRTARAACYRDGAVLNHESTEEHGKTTTTPTAAAASCSTACHSVSAR
jgi:hypothetical protein